MFFTPVCQPFCSQRGVVSVHVSQVTCSGGSASRGVCLQGGQHPGGSLHPVGVCIGGVGGGADPRDTSDTTGYGLQADGTHPTGMHSRLLFI